MENGHLSWIFPLKIVIFHCYVSSPEGNRYVIVNKILKGVVLLVVSQVGER